MVLEYYLSPHYDMHNSYYCAEVRNFTQAVAFGTLSRKRERHLDPDRFLVYTLRPFSQKLKYRDLQQRKMQYLSSDWRTVNGAWKVTSQFRCLTMRILFPLYYFSTSFRLN